MKQSQHIVMPLDHMEELYNSKNPLIRYVHNNRLKCISNAFSESHIKNKKVLDAGCGEGHLLNMLFNLEKNNNYYGIDITPVAIKQAKKRCEFAKIKLGNLYKTGYPSSYFDVIVSTEVLEHIIEVNSVLKELKRILKPKGLLIITFPNENLWTFSRFLLGKKPIKVPDHVNSFFPKKFKEMIGLKTIMDKGLPFGLPFVLSLGHLIVFENKKV